MRIVYRLMAAIGLMLTSPAVAQIDQQSTQTNINFGGSSIGQSFIPTTNKLDFVRVSIRTTGASTTTLVEIYSGVGYNSFVGLSTEQTYTNMGVESKTFVFTTPLSLTPGQAYSFRLSNTAGSLYAVAGQTTDAYAGGTRLSATGNPLSGDIAFAEGTLAGTPEPAAWALMILGFSAVGSTLRRSKRRIVPRPA